MDERRIEDGYSSKAVHIAIRRLPTSLRDLEPSERFALNIEARPEFGAPFNLSS